MPTQSAYRVFRSPDSVLHLGNGSCDGCKLNRDHPKVKLRFQCATAGPGDGSLAKRCAQCIHRRRKCTFTTEDKDRALDSSVETNRILALKRESATEVRTGSNGPLRIPTIIDLAGKSKGLYESSVRASLNNVDLGIPYLVFRGLEETYYWTGLLTLNMLQSMPAFMPSKQTLRDRLNELCDQVDNVELRSKPKELNRYMELIQNLAEALASS